ncbi:EF-hand domain-containing protein [Bordetella sp. 2513F-2]
MNTHFGAVAGTLLLVLAAMPVHAHTPATGLHEAHLKQVDTDGNGGVSKAEYQAYMISGFSRIDADGDGSLGKGELSGILTEEQIAIMDVDKDGKVTQVEYMEQVLRDFDAADRVKDGELK